MSNDERQRRFRARNPGYFRRPPVNRQAIIAAVKAARPAAEQASIVQREPLMLPAPVVTAEIPGVNTIPTPQEKSLLDRLNAIPLQRD